MDPLGKPFVRTGKGSQSIGEFLLPMETFFFALISISILRLRQVTE